MPHVILRYRLPDEQAELNAAMHAGGRVRLRLDAAHADMDRLWNSDRHHIPDAGKMAESPTNHDAVPDAIAVSDEGRNDKAVASHCHDGTGNTPTLTDAEREAIEVAAIVTVDLFDTEDNDISAVLRHLLDRLRT